jgi:hypothetical protein
LTRSTNAFDGEDVFKHSVAHFFAQARQFCSTAFAGGIDSPDLEMMYAIFFNSFLNVKKMMKTDV